MSRSETYDYLKKHAGGPEDVELIDAIAEIRRAVLRGEEAPTGQKGLPNGLFELTLFGLRLTLDPETAPSSIDTLNEIFRDGAHRRAEGFSGRRVKTVVDIGANEGFYSLAVGMNNPSARILAVEPNPQVCRLLEINKRKNGCAFETRNCAVTETTGTVVLSTYPHVGTVSSRNIMGLGQTWIRPDKVSSFTVPSITLPELFRKEGLVHVDLLKIDVEGDEAALLEGALKGERQAVPAAEEKTAPLELIDRIVIEWHSRALRDRCKEILSEKGFELVLEEPQRFGDLYFRRA